MRAFIAAILAAVALTGCASSGTAKTAPRATATPSSSAPAVRLDEYARQACALLDQAVDKRNAGDPTGANQDEFDAVTNAKQTQVAGLQALAAHDDESTPGKLRAWCYAHPAH